MYYIGLISGTSVDGIDAVLASFPAQSTIELIARRHCPYPSALREAILALTRPGDNEIERMAELDMRLGEEFASACHALLAEAGIAAEQVTAVGSHGQTIRHHHAGSPRFTVQIGNPAVIAEQTGIATVADFRAADIAAGGEGAPLVPAFHQFLFRNNETDRAVVNIGGIANITCLPKDASVPVTGFDTGPGNTLLDRWIQRHQQKEYDGDGEWARTGSAIPELRDLLLADAYFAKNPPKSTGQERFNLDWLLDRVGNLKEMPRPEDVQATLVDLTAVSISRALGKSLAGAKEVFVCGGGAHNRALMERLQVELPSARVDTTAALGLDPDWVEAAAFAWLARERLLGEPGNLVSVTGARRPVVLGGVFAPSPKA